MASPDPSRIIFVLLALAASSAGAAADRAVRAFFPAYEQLVLTGGTVPANKIHTLLFIKDKCPLPILGASEMLRAWRAAGAYQLGCWYPTLDDEYTYINAIGQPFHTPQDYWEAYPRGLLHDDGSVTITEPNFDSRTFFGRVQQQIALDHLRMLQDNNKP